MWSEINQLLTICKSTLRLKRRELAHKAAHRNLDATGATGTKLLEKTSKWGSFEGPAKSFERVSSSQ